jgi:hypothetical protein
MATLNIKDFPNSLFEKLQKQTEEEHRSVDQQVIHLISRSISRLKRARSIRGLGKEIWEGMDTAGYVREERATRSTPNPRRGDSGPSV